MRALASEGVFHEEDGRRFALTPIGDCLRSDAEEPVGAWAAFVGRPYYWQAWGDLLHSIRTGESAFAHRHGIDPWGYRARNPEEAAIFDRAMADLARRASRSTLDAYDFGRHRTIVDVGGGRGELLVNLLKAHPAMQGVLFDLPHVVEAAGGELDAAGVGERCRTVAGSFFDEVPQGADAYVLRAVLHDWDDPEAVAILETCRRAMAADASLLVIERDIGPPNARPDAKFSDLNMLVAPGGRERSIAEYGALFVTAGFRLAESPAAGFGLHVIVGVPMPDGTR
ncbi:Mitomycin biosynthesis 6-O-methyltransferase [Capillimicrobium parvum]|uniref:Mitomycin biosynthesis 6-O-methyltransferase n=1 Tax=Capillimicrobium parvum TaxID=2884022 RepID=A0A9E7C0R7_9ACTN|nr:Mitomycin biosynthesis 6-O-methyltransferase [Capillimicrobium parvum]